MGRIKWIDSSRGLAILCLIFIHYVGALESRQFITYELMNIIKAVFRVATPYFIFIFGFTFSIVYAKKLTDFTTVKLLYKKLMYRLILVLIARDIIVLIGAIRYPEMAENLWSILLYQTTSKSGEILTFYFFAIISAPLALLWMKSKSKTLNILAIISLYSISYYIGVHFTNLYDFVPFRLFFYDVYAFFPFFSLVMFGIFSGLLYRELSNDTVRLKVFIIIAMFFLLTGLSLLFYFIPEPIHTLSIAGLKSPPHIIYMLIYSGLSIIFTVCIAVSSSQKYKPIIILNFLDVLGRNSLLSYVLHYFLFLAGPISLYIFGIQNNHYELYTFIAVLFILFTVIYGRDSFKQKKAVIKRSTNESRNYS